jgi:hypothetical protein
MRLEMEAFMRIGRFAAISILGLQLTSIPFPLAAQETVTVREGDRVKVTYHSNGSHTVAGSFLGDDERSILVSPFTNHVVPIPRDQVVEFLVLRGKSNRALWGLGRGAAIGALSGALVGLAFWDAWSLGSVDVSSAEAAGYVGAYGALYGGVFGLGVGLFMREDRWEEIRLPPVFPTFQATSTGRWRIGFSIPLGK